MHTRKRKCKHRGNTKHKGGNFIIHSTRQTRKDLPYTCEYIENKPFTVKKAATKAEEQKFAEDAIAIQNAMNNYKKDTEYEINEEFAYLIQDNKKAKKELENKLRENITLTTTASSPKLPRSGTLRTLARSVSSRFLQSPLDRLLSLTNLNNDEKETPKISIC